MPRTIAEIRESRRAAEAALVKATKEGILTHAIVVEFLRACDDEVAASLNEAEYLNACEIEVQS